MYADVFSQTRQTSVRRAVAVQVSNTSRRQLVPCQESRGCSIAMVGADASNADELSAMPLSRSIRRRNTLARTDRRGVGRVRPRLDVFHLRGAPRERMTSRRRRLALGCFLLSRHCVEGIVRYRCPNVTLVIVDHKINPFS